MARADSRRLGPRNCTSNLVERTRRQTCPLRSCPTPRSGSGRRTWPPIIESNGRNPDDQNFNPPLMRATRLSATRKSAYPSWKPKLPKLSRLSTMQTTAGGSALLPPTLAESRARKPMLPTLPLPQSWRNFGQLTAPLRLNFRKRSRRPSRLDLILVRLRRVWPRAIRLSLAHSEGSSRVGSASPCYTLRAIRKDSSALRLFSVNSRRLGF